MTNLPEIKTINREQIQTNILKEQNPFRSSLRSAFHSELSPFMVKALDGLGVTFNGSSATYSDAIISVLLKEALNANLQAIKLITELTDIPPQKQMAPDGLMRLDDDPQNCIESGS